MPGQTIGVKMNYGYPGQISRHGDEVSRTRPIKKDSADIRFGHAVMQNEDGTVQAFKAGATADKFAGVAMRKVKGALQWENQNFGYYRPEEPCDVLERGTVTVECVNGEPKVGGTVFVYINKVNDQKIPGTFSAIADGANTLELKNVRWGTSGKDARGVAELVIVSRWGV